MGDIWHCGKRPSVCVGSVACVVFFRSAGSGPSDREWQHVAVAGTESVYATRNDVVFVCLGNIDRIPHNGWLAQ